MFDHMLLLLQKLKLKSEFSNFLLSPQSQTYHILREVEGRGEGVKEKKNLLIIFLFLSSCS